MRSYRVIWPEPGEAAVEEYPLPSPGAGEVLIRTTISLISPGTERAFFLGLPNTSASFPQRPGYSLVGRVQAVGEGIEGIRIGDRVAATAPHSSHINVRASDCLKVPDSLSDESAVFFNLASISLQGVRKARIELGEPVIVIGAGMIGLLAMQLARLSGAIPLVSIDRDETRCEMARTAGADSAVLIGDGLLHDLSSAIDAEDSPVVIEATGHPSAITVAFRVTRRMGRLVLLGSTRGVNDGVNFYRDVHAKGITLIGAHGINCPKYDSSPGLWTVRDDRQTVHKLLEMRRLSFESLITHRFAWNEATQAYALLKDWDVRALGMVLDWRANSEQSII